MAQSESIIRLRERELFSIRGDCGGMVVSCRTGDLWLTQEGDPNDHLIGAGENFTISRKGLVLINALSDASFEIADRPE